MKRLALLFLLMLPLLAIAAPPVPYYVGKFAGDGTSISNVPSSTLTAGVTNQWKSDATNAAASKIAMSSGTGTNIVLEGLTTATNLTTTTFRPTVGVASTVAAFNASTNIYSIANGAGFLSNDGGGAFTWGTSLNASNLSGIVPNGSLPGWIASGTDVVNATNTSALAANGLVKDGDTRTIGVAGLIVSNTMSAGEFDVGTLVVTNPPALNLSAATNYGGTYYASNALSGGQFPIGSLATGVTAVAGPFLTSNTLARSYSYNANSLTNISPANIVSGTLPQAILSSATSALTGPAQNELPTAQWIRGLFNNGVLDYATTNVDSVAANPATLNQVVYQFSTAVPQTAVRTWASGFITNNGYIGSVVTTNTFTFLQGPVVVNAYIGATTAGPIGNYFLTLHPEIYYSYDRTNWSGDYTAQAQSIIGNATNLYQFVITFPSVTATNSAGFYVQRRLKIDTASTAGNVPTVYFFVGTNTFTSGNASHMAFSGPSSAAGNAYLANNQTFTGNNIFNGLEIFGDANHTNAWAYSPSGVFTTNANGNIQIGNGAVQASGNISTTNGQFTGNGAGITNLQPFSFGFIADGGGSAIVSANITDSTQPVEFSGTIVACTVIADQVGSFGVDIYKTNHAGLVAGQLPASSTRVCAADVPALNNTNWNYDTSLTGWITSVAQGDVFTFHMLSNSTCKHVNVTIKVQK